MIEKTYDPAEIEKRIYDAWEKSGAFKAGARPDAKPYCIVIPPPNVTGSLHMGHALNNALQDILVRYQRLRGRDVLWQVGTDHAGIATQMVVERKLAQEGNQSRRELGRDEFVKRVWAWKAESGGTIVSQLRRLGASCDWSRERFTMDEGLSRAVRRVFVQLYKEGLIYKDKRLVNWDTKLLTAISDLEVVQIQVTGSYKWSRESGQPLDHAALGKVLARNPSGHLYYIDYPLEDGSGKITVATTRPETMLGDVAVAVHPKDERYATLVGKSAILPLIGRRIPIIADEHTDPEKGSGAVKITPAHDFNDFEVGKRHGLAQIDIFTVEGKLNENAPAKYRGNDRFVARRMIIADLDAQSLMGKIEPVTHQVPYGDRSNEVVEPYLTEQWYVRADVLAKPALEAVQRGETVFVPKNWEKTYFNWLNEIQPWCISRQLWWGHQIPAWYAPDGKVFVEENEEAAKAAAREHFGKPTELKRDEDVLDTWFSSALWPFSTLGWPDETPELKRFYRTDVLVTGFDIIFFWVARMMMMGLHFMEEVPFHTVYIHALVRDASGAKMSKSKGNVMDPLEIIDKYGADALRFTLAAMAAQGRDIKLSTQRVEGYKGLGNKLWSSTRFALLNDCKIDPQFDPSHVKETLNRWIIGEIAKTEREVSQAIEAYKFNEAAGAIYRFIWGVFCDWYVEFTKPVFAGGSEAARGETRATTAWVIDQALALLHPFMPFLTEELWTRTAEFAGRSRKTSLILAQWPSLAGLGDQAASEEMNWVVDLISRIRSVRTEMRVPAGAQVPLKVLGASNSTRERISQHRDLVTRLARLSSIEDVKAPLKGALQIVLGEATYYLPVADLIDVAAEKVRLAKEIERARAEIDKIDKKLGNADFVAKAPEEVVEENRERREEFGALIARLSRALEAF